MANKLFQSVPALGGQFLSKVRIREREYGTDIVLTSLCCG